MKKPEKKKRKSKTQLEPGDYLDAEQVRFILEMLKNQAKDGKFRTAVRLFIFQLLVNTGLRCGEAAHLEMRDLPCCHGKDQIAVRWAISKSRRNRGVIISDECKRLISDYVDRFCDKKKKRSALLENEYGNPMTPANIYDRMQTIARHAGIALRPHMLRHTYLTLLYGIEKDQMFVKDQGGHVKLDTTNIYIHIGSDERKRQVSRLGWLAT